MESSWRKFEWLVARIEETLAPEGAIVKSPDRIKDLVTGQMREVDASIRYKVGSAPILITVECRERAGVQDMVVIPSVVKADKLQFEELLYLIRSGVDHLNDLVAALILPANNEEVWIHLHIEERYWSFACTQDTVRHLFFAGKLHRRCHTHGFLRLIRTAHSE